MLWDVVDTNDIFDPALSATASRFKRANLSSGGNFRLLDVTHPALSTL
jgi:hypothetical protein